jgi:hypothetical protein
LPNALISVLLTKSETQRREQGIGETTLGGHRFVHVFDAAHLAQPFSSLLNDMLYRGLLGRVDVDVGDETVGMVEACGMTVVKSWVEGKSEDAVEKKMIEQLERLLCGVWLENWEAEGNGIGVREGSRSSCMPS